MGHHRWQGYTHEELYAQLHTGPGPSAATASITRWSRLGEALAEIDADLHAALRRLAGQWEGAAADSAQAGLTPLARWSAEAREAAEAMRLSVEQQAEHLAAARAAMPPPVPVTAERPPAFVSALVHLFGGQCDYELQEAAAAAAEQRAFEVMATYEANTTATTTALAPFTAPPQVAVSSAPTPAGGGGSGVTVSFVPGGAPAVGPVPAPAVRGAEVVTPRQRSRPVTSPPTTRGHGTTGSGTSGARPVIHTTTGPAGAHGPSGSGRPGVLPTTPPPPGPPVVTGARHGSELVDTGERLAPPVIGEDTPW